MTRTYHKVGDKVYYEDSENPGVYRIISGWEFANAPSNAIQVGPDLYNTSENIQELKKAEEYFAKQEEEQKKQEQIETSKSFAQRQAEAQAQVKPVPHVTSPEYSQYVNRIEQLKDMGVNASTAVDIATTEYSSKQKQSILDKVEENTQKIDEAYAEFQRLVRLGWEKTASAKKASEKFNIPMDEIWKKETVELSKKLEEKMHQTARNIPSVFGVPIVSKVMEAVQKIYGIKKETKGAPGLEEARIEKTISGTIEQQRLYNEQMNINLNKIATPITSNMPSKYISVAYAGGIASILARIGSAIWDFVSKNPRVTAGTITTTALSQAITQTAKTEEEKNQIVKEIAEQNPNIASEIVHSQTNPFASMSDMGKYIALGIIGVILLYIVSKK